MSRSVFAAARGVLENAVQKDEYPNFVLAVSHEGDAISLSAAPEGLNERSIFPLASITKPFIATALMRLVERGRLILNEPVALVLPEFVGEGREHVTPWHLLTHTGGLVDDNAALQGLLNKRAPREAISQLAMSVKLDFEPGSRSRYGNFGFLILAELISTLSGTAYPRFLHEQVFAPLGMTDTAFAPTDAERAVALEGADYEPTEEAYLNALANPAGGLWSTAADLLTFGQTLLNGGEHEGYRLLSRAALDTMTRRHTEGLFSQREGRLHPANNGLSWAKRSHAGGIIGSERAYGHGGATGTFLWIDPEYGLVFVLLSSRWGTEPGVAMRALNAVYGEL